MKFLFPLICVFLLASNTFAQNIDTTLARYADQYGQERIYIHFDKSSYTPGDTIWFKSYIMKAIFPSDESKTIYADWTDLDGKLITRTVSPIIEGGAFGQLEVPENYKGNYIHVKAYTKWMLNFDSAFLYNKDIQILSASPETVSQLPKPEPEITFFPEGGDAIAGVVNKIAFKANDQWGRPVKIRGVIKNGQGEITDSLNVMHDGMGYFFISPNEGEKFTATWKDENNKSHVTKLPSVRASGAALKIVLDGNKRKFLISTNPTGTLHSESIHILGTMYQQQVFHITKIFENGVIKGIIPTKGLPSGILVITVFDENWKPLSERITYVNNQEFYFKPEITVAHWGLNKRARNEIEITVPNNLTANLSVSVTDLGISIDTSDHIISHLMLTGELKGKVYQPSYYFQNNSDSVSKNLDLVMLTHGWRRFNWEKVVAGEYPEIIYPKDTSYLSISGKIFGASPVQLRNAGNIILLYNQLQKGNQIFSIPIMADGTFNDPSLVLFDTAKIYYQLPQDKGLDDASVQFMRNRLPPLSNNIAASSLFDNHQADTTGNYHQLQLANAAADALSFYKGKVLETVIIERRKKSPLDLLDEKYASGLFQGGNGYQFDLINDPFAAGSMGVFNYLQGKVAGLQISSGIPPSLTWRGGAPTVFLNEMPSTIDMVYNIPMDDIAYIKVIRPPFIGAPGGGTNGAIAIYTRKGGDQKYTPGEGLATNTVTGYTAIRQFYSPDYGLFAPKNEKKDYRTTLYWNPQVETKPGSNKVLLTFYNNDVSHAFRIIIEGITKDGRLTHVEKIMD